MKEQRQKQYPKCKIHPKQFAQLVCLSCDRNCLACPLCVDIQHQMHKMMSLKKFMDNEIPKLYKKSYRIDTHIKDIQNNNQIDIACCNIQTDQTTTTKMYNIELLEIIEDMRKQVGHEINQLQSSFQQKGQVLSGEVDFICGSYDAKNLQYYIQAVKSKINKGAQIPSEHQLLSKIQHLVELMQSVAHDSVLQIRRIIFNMKHMHSCASDIFLNSTSKSQFSFSEMHKHQSLLLEHQIKAITSKKPYSIVKNIQFDNSYHTCAVSPALNPFHPTVSFRVKKTDNKCTWLGISDLKSLQQSNYINTYKIHGANYWLWQAGGDQSAEFYSGYETQDQSKPSTGWNFEAGDIVSISIIYEKNGLKKVKFQKNIHLSEAKLKDQLLQEYTCAIDQNIGHYYPCVSLGEEGQMVQIIYN